MIALLVLNVHFDIESVQIEIENKYSFKTALLFDSLIWLGKKIYFKKKLFSKCGEIWKYK